MYDKTTLRVNVRKSGVALRKVVVVTPERTYTLRTQDPAPPMLKFIPTQLLWALGGALGALGLAAAVYFLFFFHALAPKQPLSVPQTVNTMVGVLTPIQGETTSKKIHWKLLSGPAPAKDVTVLSSDPFTCSFVAPVAGDYKVGACCVVSKDEAALAFCTVHVTAYNPGPVPPGPGPNPPPNPGPNPVFPDGKFKLAASTYSMALKDVTTDQQRAKSAKALAGSFQSIASAIGAGTITDLKDALAKTHYANLTALKGAGTDPATWDAFGNDMKAALYQMYQNKQINNASDIAVAWGEVAQGLNAVQ
jgi:hypothetical protein